MKDEQAKIRPSLLTQIKRDKIRYKRNSVSEIIRLYRRGFLTEQKLRKLLDEANREWLLKHNPELHDKLTKLV